jgi:hypothetical protein
MAQSIIWNTQIINETLENLRYGADVNLSCFHERDPELKGDNILFQLTHEEEQEFIKCSQDVKHFVEKYCRFLTDYGRKVVDLREFQRDILDTLGGEIWIDALNDFGPRVKDYILMASRQTGKTTTIAAFFAWYICFHTDRNLLIIANKQATTTEIVAKVLDVFRGLPFFLKPGIKQIGALGLRLDNGCMLTSQATTKTAAIGFAIHVLYIDEFAHIPQNIVKSLWRSVYPTLSSSLISQCIISSTPDGMDNMFYDVWNKAETGKNDFVSKRVDYWEVPGHDDAWAEKTRRNFGDEEFAQEFELSFDRKSNLLLTGEQLAWLKRTEIKYKYHELEKSDLDELLYRGKLLWHPEFDPNESFDPKLDRFIFSNDIAEGKEEGEKKENDYNVTLIYKIEPKTIAKLRKLRKDERQIQNMFRLRQVGIFRDNDGDEEVMAKVNKALAFDQFNPEIIKMVTEMNFNGKSFLNKFMDHDDFFNGMILHTYHTAPVPGEKNRKKMGYKTTSNKDYFCKLGKKLIGNKTILPNDTITGKEFRSFGKVKGSWKGIAKHDDTVMSCLNISRLYEEEEYADWLFDFLEEMPDSPNRKIIRFLLEHIDESDELSDDAFKTLYNDPNGTSESDYLMKIFEENHNQNRYPGMASPWKPNMGHR